MSCGSARCDAGYLCAECRREAQEAFDARCDGCGTPFEKTHHLQRYCTPACRPAPLPRPKSITHTRDRESRRDAPNAQLTVGSTALRRYGESSWAIGGKGDAYDAIVTPEPQQAWALHVTATGEECSFGTLRDAALAYLGPSMPIDRRMEWPPRRK